MNTYSTSECQSPSTGSNTGRIETLADGVFAIVLTLLVLDIKAPQAASNAELLHQLLALWPKLFSYLLSFVILGLFWFGHQMEFHYIRRCDRINLWLNLLFLMCIAFIPFSAALLGENGQYQIATVVYGSNLFAAGLVRYLNWQYATDGHRLVEPDMDVRIIRAVKRAFVFVPLIYLLAIGVSFVSVKVSLALYTLSPIIGAMRINSIFHRHVKT